MSQLKLSIATTDYDHFRDFRLGVVRAEGIDHTWLNLGHHECFARFTANREFAECIVTYDGDVPEEIKTVLFDPQTAGGLLAAVAPGSAKEFLDALQAAGIAAQEIGEISAASKPAIHVAR